MSFSVLTLRTSVEEQQRLVIGDAGVKGCARHDGRLAAFMVSRQLVPSEVDWTYFLLI